MIITDLMPIGFSVKKVDDNYFTVFDDLEMVGAIVRSGHNLFGWMGPTDSCFLGRSSSFQGAFDSLIVSYNQKGKEDE